MQTINLGIAGFGRMGRHLTRDLLAAAAGVAEIAGVVEPDDAAYQAGADFIQRRPPRFSSIRGMLKQTGPDAIVIAAPNHVHLDCLRELEGCRIPILLEKPLESEWGKIIEVARFARRYAGPVMVDHCMRYSPISGQARELLAQGAIGRICSANFIQHCSYGNAMYRTFRRTMRGGGGMFIEKATHDFDIMLDWLQARPLQVAAMGGRYAFGGGKPDDLRCAQCPERMDCPESVSNQRILNGWAADMENETRADACVFSREIDVPDSASCLIECERGLIAAYAHSYFSPASYSTREYEVTGLLGVMKVSYSLPEQHKRGRIAVYPRYGTAHDVRTWEFDYLGRIHYNAGPEVARHFLGLIRGAIKQPRTTVMQALAAEAVGYAATRAVAERNAVEVAALIPSDLRGDWQALWPARKVLAGTGWA